MQTQASYKNKVDLYADLFAEHRGVSYGLYNQANTLIYPILRLAVKDTLSIFRKTIIVSGKAGQFLDEKLDAGLMVYNIDEQGFQINASYKNFQLQYTLYGDMYGGIGLNIDDLKSYSVRKNFSDSTSFIGASYISARPAYYPLKNYYNLNVFANKQFKKVSLYGQVGFRPLNYGSFYSSANIIKQAAFLLGAEINGHHKGFYYSAKVEFRHYGFLFNYEYFDARVRYRKPAANIYSMYANTVGEFLYPLRKYDTPFSQWALFTEYVGFNTTCFTLAGKCNYHLNKKLDLFLDYDVNSIMARFDKVFGGNSLSTSNFVYPFFNTGVAYKPADNVFLKAAMTNKAMNLDISYPTHYLVTNPQVELSLMASFF